MTDGVQLKEDVLEIKARLEKVEAHLKNKMNELAYKEKQWEEMDRTAEELKKNDNVIVKFNISGKNFQTRLETLLNTKDTLFYKMIISKEVDFHKEIFFDRNPKYFGIILDFLRTKNINLKRYKGQKLQYLRMEADYFEISEINALFSNKATEVEFESFEFNGAYISGGIQVGTNKVEDLTDSSGMKGICANCNGWIIIELNGEFDINGLSIMGHRGNPNYWSPENGAGATIYVSTDKTNWQPVSTIPSGYGSFIKQVTFSASRVRYIKFQFTSYLGIGYLKIHT